MALTGLRREGDKICFACSVPTNSIPKGMVKNINPTDCCNDTIRHWQMSYFCFKKKKENMEEDAKEHNLGWIFSLRMKSWKERMGKERMGKWVIGGKVGCPVPHWGPEGSVATAPCQNITSSVLWDTWLFTPEHARWLPQLSDHVLHVWKDSRGLCHSITCSV